jgi:hypothetical protein
MASAPALSRESNYWEQFYAALTRSSKEEQDLWMENEVSRYMTQFKMSEETAWRTIACNLAYFAGYYGASAVKKMRQAYGVFPECFDSPEFRQEQRLSTNGTGKRAADSPV